MLRALGAALGFVLVFAATPALGAGTTYTIGPAVDVSAPCAGQNAEVEQAVDPALGYVYETWMGCRGIALARSTDGGRTFEEPLSVPGSVGSNYNSWDPAVAVGAGADAWRTPGWGGERRAPPAALRYLFVGAIRRPCGPK